MKISSKTDYAIRTVIDLALHTKSGVSKVRDIAKRQSISRDYLQQILLSLKTAGIVNSKRGLDGGYSLAIDPQLIKLSSIVKLTNPTLLTQDADNIKSNRESGFVRSIWNHLTDDIDSKLTNISIQEICDQLAVMKDNETVNYII